MKRALSIAILLGLCSRMSSAETYLCFGDSITFANTGSSTAGYLGPLAGYLGSKGVNATLINRGKSGETVLQGVSRLQSELATRYDYVLIMEGTNDVFRWVAGEYTMDTTVDALKTMIQSVRSSGATPIVATIVPLNGAGVDPNNAQVNEYNRRVRGLGATVAEVNGAIAPYVNNYTYEDKVHPNSLGHTLVAEGFAAALTGEALASVDLAPPIPTSLSPAPFSTRVPRETDIEISVVEAKHPFDAASATFSVDGAPVVPLVSASANSYHYSYRFPAPLRFGQSVRVDFSVADTNTPPNPLVLQYTFQATAGNGTNGDLDFSGRVDGWDLAILSGSFGAGRNDPRYLFGADIDASGFIDGVDLALLTGSFGGPP